MANKHVLVVGADGNPEVLKATDTPVYSDGTPLAEDQYKSTHRARAVQTSNISDTAAAAPDEIDGVTPSVGDTILYVGATDRTKNGLFVVTAVGTGSNGVWARHPDMDDDAEINAAVHVQVIQGDDFGDSLWVLSSNGGLEIGTSDIDFVKQKADRRRTTYAKDIFLTSTSGLSSAVVMNEVATREAYLVGATILSGEARTSGTFALVPHINGTPVTPTQLNLLIDGTDTAKDRATAPWATDGLLLAPGDTFGFIATASAFVPFPVTFRVALELEYRS